MIVTIEFENEEIKLRKNQNLDKLDLSKVFKGRKSRMIEYASQTKTLDIEVDIHRPKVRQYMGKETTLKFLVK